MPIDLSQNIARFEADDLRMFSYIDTVSIPSCVAFNIYGTDGSVLAPVAVQSGVSVTVSGGNIDKGMFYIFRQLASSRGFYTAEWKVWGSGTAQSSLFVVAREVFEIIRTEPQSFISYGDKGNVMRVARQLIGRGDLTEYDVKPHMEAAYSYINARLGSVVTVPLAPASNYIEQGEEILAIYTLYGTFGGTERGEIPPSFNKLREDFVGYLDAVVKGEATVDGTLLTGTIGAINYFTGGIEGGKPTHGRSPWEDQIVDQNILDKESDDRS